MKYFIIVVLFITCTHPKNEKDSNLLIKTEYEFLMDADRRVNKYYEDRSAFIQKYTRSIQNKDVLEVTTAHIVNACGTMIPYINLNGDTIELLIKRDHSRESCKSEELRLYKYYISNPDKKKYFIKY